jgi:hypothetical protein
MTCHLAIDYELLLSAIFQYAVLGALIEKSKIQSRASNEGNNYYDLKTLQSQ